MFDERCGSARVRAFSACFARSYFLPSSDPKLRRTGMGSDGRLSVNASTRLMRSLTRGSLVLNDRSLAASSTRSRPCFSTISRTSAVNPPLLAATRATS